MATSLASQLYRMRNVDRSLSTQRAQKTRASFLFDGRQAADMDNQTVFDIGQDGLRELQQINVRFSSYATTLFSVAVKDLDRVQQTREENQKLDESIRGFLFLLAPHFLTRPAGKALEWLVRRFRIHEFNTRDVVAAFLPYHETKAFLALLTIMTFESSDMGLFGFLAQQRKARRVVDRTTLLAQCQRDWRLAAFIFDAQTTACELGAGYAGQHAFYATVASQFVGGLTAVGDGELQFVLPYVVSGLQQQARDAQVAAYMVAGALAARVALTAAALERVLCAMAEQPADVDAMALAVALLLQTQAEARGAVTPRLAGLLSAQTGFAAALGRLAAERDVTQALHALFGALAPQALDGGDAAKLLAALVPEIPRAHAPALSAQLVAAFLSRDAEADPAGADVVSLVQLRYSQALEDAVGAAAERAAALENTEQRDRALRRLQALQTCGAAGRGLPLRETATTLFLGLEHADAGVRLVAATALRDIMDGRSEHALPHEEAGRLVLGRLKHDDDERVLAAVLPLATLVPRDALAPALGALLASGRVPLERLGADIVGALAATKPPQQADAIAALFAHVLDWGITQAVTRAVVTHAAPGWLAALGSVAEDVRTNLGAEYNAQAVAALAAALVRDWEPIQSTWEGLLTRGALTARATAIAVGAQAVEMFADAGNAELAVNAARVVVDAALGLLPAAAGAVDGEWASLLAAAATDRDREGVCGRIAAHSLAVVLNALAGVAPLQPGCWFPALQTESSSSTETAYRRLLCAAFNTMAERGVGGALLGRLLQRNVGGSWAQFLAASWLSEAGATVRARSLLAFRALATAETAKSDFQTLLPAVLAALGDDDAQVRAAAAMCVKALRRGSAASDIYMHADIYGTASADLLHLPPAVATRFIQVLAAHADLLAGDAGALRTELRTIAARGVGTGASKPKLGTEARACVAPYLLSHIVAADAVAPRLQLRLIAALSGVASLAFLEQLPPLLSRRIAGAADLPAADSDEEALVRALFDACYGAQRVVQLQEEPEHWAAFLRIVDGKGFEASRPAAYAQQLAFQTLTDGLGAALDASGVAAVTTTLCNIALRGDAPDARSGTVTLRGLFSMIPLDAAAVGEALCGAAEQLGAGEAPGAKRARSTARVAEPDVATLLECMQNSAYVADNAAAAAGVAELVGVLVGRLGETRAAARDYELQVALGLLGRMVAGGHVAESAVRVDAVVQALRASESPQTHNQALLLLAAIAAQHPDVVLHHVMALFTFMGANVVRQDDAYSFHVMEHSLRTIVPALVRAHTTRAAQVAHAGPVLRVFVDALTHIPRHRRMPLFTALVSALGPAYAAPVAALLLEKHAARVLAARAARESDDVLAFALDLARALPPSQQVAVCDELVRDLLLLPPINGADASDAAVAALFVGVRQMSAPLLRAFRLVSLDFVLRLLTTRHTSTQTPADSSLASTAAALLQLSARLAADHGKLDAVAVRAAEQAQRLVHSALDATHTRMSRPAFAAAVAELLRHADLRVRRRAIALARARLDELDVRRADASDVDQAMGMLRAIAELPADIASADDEDERASCAQAALLCVATAARRLAALRPAEVASLIGAVAGTHALQSSSAVVSSAAATALAVLCDQLGSRLIPALPQYLPTLLKCLRDGTARFDDASTDDLARLIAALAAVLPVVEHMGAFLAPSLPPLLACLLGPALRGGDEDDSSAAMETADGRATLCGEARRKASEVLAAMARHIPPRHLLPAQLAFFQKDVLRQGAGAVAAFTAFAGRTASALQPGQLQQFHRQLFRLFLAIFDAPRCPTLSRDDAELIEETALDAFMRLAVRLNENQFRPLFLAFLEWASADPATLAQPAPIPSAQDTADDYMRLQDANETRLRAFYRVLNALLARLKTLAVPYYALVLDTTVVQLQRFAVSYDSIELQEEADRREKPAPSALWGAIVESVRLSALHDTSAELWSEAAYRRIVRPLVNQLANTKRGNDAAPSHAERVRSLLAPACAQLAAAVANDALWKLLNQDVLLKARADDPTVRHSTLLVLQALYNKLGEEYLILLPETIPFLAELLEDDDSLVERTTHETIKLIESLLGESLQSYLR
ncbi:snoRNA-binding rRNA-processing protein utp10 [Coemansia guatemalensis]|uniref:U3 small nucleolar RNA-associated protein 10 n=1 Tax=Coemansia guatemalensis TaxID=2761395 RepID=A0A9W8LW84_9FUNG|nr:snoRNA-binding rRNA-processing protein utp10 [Coemansia guatemalensis]